MEIVHLNDFKAQWEEIRSKALAAVDRVGRSGWLILGSEVEAFESDLAQYWGLSHAIGCGNGLDAIEISLRCMGLEPGQKVLTTPLSAFATTLAILRAGGVPVFVDTERNGLMDLNAAEAALQKDPGIRFMVPVHLYGHALPLQRLEYLRDRYELRIVEDCAQAIGARSHGRPVGKVGQMSATSFYPTKNLGAMGDGGAILTDDSELAQRARGLRDYGQTAKYVHSELGLNSRLDELHAAILRDALLPVLARGTERRTAIASAYMKGIRNESIQILPVPEGSQSVWHLFPVTVPADRRSSFMAFAKERGIQTGIHYPRLITDQDALIGAGTLHVSGMLEQSKALCASEVSLPIHPYLSAAEVDRVIDCCNAWAG